MSDYNICWQRDSKKKEEAVNLANQDEADKKQPPSFDIPLLDVGSQDERLD